MIHRIRNKIKIIIPYSAVHAIPFMKYTRDMTFKAAGAYIARLRIEAKMSRFALARMVNTSDSNMMRIEQGEQEPRGALLGMIVRKLNANADDLFDLLLSPDTEEQEGTARAEEWIKSRVASQNTAQGIHPDIRGLISKMSDYDLGKWVALGERLVEERTRG